MSIYVEIPIRGTMDELWRLTQTPGLHRRWDLRFTDIEYLPRADENEAQRFLYATRIGFGLAIQGEGETIGQRNNVLGSRTSALKFWSGDPKSLIRDGAGYWRYVPVENGVIFSTSYDYRVRFGALGRAFDALVFRPLLGWATAWSFDRLRLWIEEGVDPAVSLERSLIHMIVRFTLAFVWLYQGLIPKLLAENVDELTLIRQGGISAANAPWIMHAIGWSEVIFGLALLLCFRQRWHFPLTMGLVTAAMADVAINSPAFLSSAFNGISLNGLMIALAAVGWVASRKLPSARCCVRVPAKRQI